MNPKLKGNPSVGSSIDSLFAETGELQEVKRGARQKIIAYDLAQQMARQKVSSSEMAKRMGTSRTAIYRLLDPSYDGATIRTLHKAAKAIGYKIEIKLVRA